MKKIILSSFIIFILSAGFVLAQEQSGNISISIDEQYLTPIEIKDINVNVDSEKNLISGSFILKNRSSKPMPEVGYTVRLKKGPEKVGIVEDAAGAPLFSFYQSSEEFFYYAPQEERKFNFSLSYPDSIKSGTYQIIISSHDKITNYFGSTLKEIHLEGTNELVYLDPQKCFVRVHDVNFFLNEGPPVEPNSQVPVICTLTNPTSRTLTLIPQIEVAELSLQDFANSVYYKKQNLSSFILESQETKEITFTLTAPQEPRAYNTILTLLDNNQNQLSNKLSLRYVVRGEGARIKGVDLSKTFYAEGEKAEVDVEYYASSDLHWLPENTLGDKYSDPDVSPFQADLVVKITGDKGLCGQIQKTTPEIKTAFGTTKDKLEIPISKDCYNPKVKVSIGENGKNYSEYQLAFKTNPQDISAKDISAKEVTPTNFKKYLLYLGIIIALIILIYLFMTGRFKSKPLSLLIILVLVGGFMFIGAKSVKAGCGYRNEGEVGDGNTFAVVRGINQGSTYVDCAHKVVGVALQNVYVRGNNINGTVNLWSIDYASGNQNVGEHVALTYYIQDSEGNFVKSPNTASSILLIQSTEDPADGNTGTQHILPFSIDISNLQGGNYTVYLDIRPGLRHKSFKDVYPRRINNAITSSSRDFFDAGSWGPDYYYMFHSPYDWMQFLNNNKVQAFVEPFCTSKYQGFGDCPKGQGPYSWYYIPPLVRSFGLSIKTATTAFLSFSANSTIIKLGESSTLSWSSQNVDSCLASGAWSGDKPPSGSEKVSPSKTSTYTLSCFGPGGYVSKSVTITVNPQCSDGIDNDGDGKIDYPADPGCTSPSDDDERNVRPKFKEI